MKLDQLVNELSEREAAPRTQHEAWLTLAHCDAASGTRPGTADEKWEWSRPRHPRPVDKALRETAFEMSRQRHRTPFARELAGREPLENIAAFGAVHRRVLSG